MWVDWQPNYVLSSVACQNLNEGVRHEDTKPHEKSSERLIHASSPSRLWSSSTPPIVICLPPTHLHPPEGAKRKPGGDYEVQYAQRQEGNLSKVTKKTVTADIVIVAAGCLGTSEILLRSKERGTLPNLSAKLGFGFSTNGDYIAFLEKTKERVSLIRGPVTTSYGHFNTTDPATGGGASMFHTLEDQGIPGFNSFWAGREHAGWILTPRCSGIVRWPIK